MSAQVNEGFPTPRLRGGCACAVPSHVPERPRRIWAAWLGLVPVFAFAAEPPPAPLPDSLPASAQVVTSSGIKIHALRTGWVTVKKTHRELDVSPWMALPAIMLGRRWAHWMPIVVYAIEHPDGVIVVDTGPSPQINDPDYYACDGRNAFFYRRNLRFAIPAGDTLGPRLAQAGIDPNAVRSLVITHFHADHIGGVDVLPNARAYTGAGNWPAHAGSFTCRLPRSFAPTAISFDGKAPANDFPASHPLTRDGKVRLVSLPGHTPGHVGVAVVDAGRSWLMAGDATFDQDQTDRGGVTGISESIDGAIATQAALKRVIADPTVTLLPAHDPGVFDRLRSSR